MCFSLLSMVISLAGNLGLSVYPGLWQPFSTLRLTGKRFSHKIRDWTKYRLPPGPRNTLTIAPT